MKLRGAALHLEGWFLMISKAKSEQKAAADLEREQSKQENQKLRVNASSFFLVFLLKRLKDHHLPGYQGHHSCSECRWFCQCGSEGASLVLVFQKGFSCDDDYNWEGEVCKNGCRL